LDKKLSLNLIEHLSNANGPSGFEDEVKDYVVQTAASFSSVHADHMNNVYLKNKQNSPAKGKTLMLDSHLDAVGLIVQAIKPKWYDQVCSPWWLGSCKLNSREDANSQSRW